MQGNQFIGEYVGYRVQHFIYIEELAVGRRGQSTVATAYFKRDFAVQGRAGERAFGIVFEGDVAQAQRNIAEQSNEAIRIYRGGDRACVYCELLYYRAEIYGEHAGDYRGNVCTIARRAVFGKGKNFFYRAYQLFYCGYGIGDVALNLYGTF